MIVMKKCIIISTDIGPNSERIRKKLVSRQLCLCNPSLSCHGHVYLLGDVLRQAD